MRTGELKRDYKGQLLCESCWNGAHYGFKLHQTTGKRTSIRFSRCLQGGCECQCRALLEEKQAKKKVMA